MLWRRECWEFISERSPERQAAMAQSMGFTSVLTKGWRLLCLSVFLSCWGHCCGGEALLACPFSGTGFSPGPWMPSLGRGDELADVLRWSHHPCFIPSAFRAPFRTQDQEQKHGSELKSIHGLWSHAGLDLSLCSAFFSSASLHRPCIHPHLWNGNKSICFMKFG